ncbi:MAG: M1 family metallopeptidase [Aureispira sp.]|nr:M1 family metallopeptidase [Aureispira sp.]
MQSIRKISTKTLSILLLSFFSIVVLQAQEKPYFQQDVDYTIEVSLDDVNHYLEGNIKIAYTNNSTDTLSALYFHLWPNAYKNSQTAFAKQLSENGDLGFYFSKKKDRGYIDSLQFTVDNEPVQETVHDGHIDIAKLSLTKPIKPGQQVIIKTPFRVKLPKTVSRLGHEGESYQITQWYPKPAVYDNKGWHTMPYLDQGEFFSEFGSFDVKITLPNNYVVGASGQLQTESEKAFLTEKSKADKKLNFEELEAKFHHFPASSPTLKTIHYTADQVHDFAWFADKRYYVHKSKVALKSGKSIETYSMFTNIEAGIWKDAINYVNRSVQFYSEVVGEYPYPQATAVQGALNAGSGMEYPMVTIIGKARFAEGLDNVITHEIGHNWFYGILGSNEREHAWMDEGWNSYVESRYMEKYYDTYPRVEYLAYLLQASKGEEQAINTPSADNIEINYYLCAYAKPTLSFRYLQTYLGRAKMDSILQDYYNKWKFKHPQPSDLKKVFEDGTDKPLDWFFDNVINSTKQIDYACTHHSCCHKEDKAELTIKNKGDIAAPFSVSAVDFGDSILNVTWFNGLDPKQDTTLEVNQSEDVWYYIIDPLEEMPEIDRNNNIHYTTGVLKKGERTKLQFGANFNNPEKPRVNMVPLLGFNCYDGFMFGLATYNLTVPVRKFQYVVAPMFGIGSLSPIGMFEFKYNFIPTHGKKPFQRLTIGLGGRSFNRSSNETFGYDLRYYRINPYIDIEFARKSLRDYSRHFLRMDNILIFDESPSIERVDTNLVFRGKATGLRTTHRVQYRHEYNHPITPFDITAAVEYANYNDVGEKEHYVKLSTEGNFKFNYSPLWSVDIRMYMGGFVFHTDRDFGNMPLQLASRNLNDYHYDSYYVGRREQGNFFEQQVAIREGGFKTPIAQATSDGRSNIFIFALNFKADVPIKLPWRTKYVKIKPYMDFGFYKNSAPSVNIASPDQQLFFNGGLMIDIWDGAAGLYIPLFGDKKLMNQLKSQGNFFRRISFSLNLHRLNPLDIAPNFEF